MPSKIGMLIYRFENLDYFSYGSFIYIKHIADLRSLDVCGLGVYVAIEMLVAYRDSLT